MKRALVLLGVPRPNSWSELSCSSEPVHTQAATQRPTFHMKRSHTRTAPYQRTNTHATHCVYGKVMNPLLSHYSTTCIPSRENGQPSKVVRFVYAECYTSTRYKYAVISASCFNDKKHVPSNRLSSLCIFLLFWYNFIHESNKCHLPGRPTCSAR